MAKKNVATVAAAVAAAGVPCVEADSPVQDQQDPVSSAQTEVERLEAQLAAAKLEARKQAALKLIETDFAAYEAKHLGRSKGASRGPSKPRGPRGEKTHPEQVLECFGPDEELGAETVLERMTASGWVTTNSQPINAIHMLLAKLKTANKLDRVSHGVYKAKPAV